MSSRRQLTLAALASLLEDITVDGGFNTDAGLMVRLGEDVELGENDPGPAILIVSGIEKFDARHTKLYSDWPISIRAIAGVIDSDFDGAWATAELVVADIERALEIPDRTLGDLVNYNGKHGLVLDSIQAVPRDAGSSVVGIDVVFIAKFQRTWGDPLGTASPYLLLYLASALADNPSGLYLLNERDGLTLIDSSGNEQNATLLAEQTRRAPGVWTGRPNFGTAFGGGVSDYAEVPTSVFDPTVGGITLECWASPNVSLPAADASLIGRTWNNPGRNNLVIYQRSNGQWKAEVFASGFLVSQGGSLSLSEAGRYDHIVATFDNAEAAIGGVALKLYINGVLERSANSAPFTWQAVTPGELPMIGWGGHGDKFAGALQGCGFYPHVLTPDQIAARYQVASAA